jgi:hypothetical protein
MLRRLPMSEPLPTIEFVGEDGVRRELDFQRCQGEPWNAMLVESRADDGSHDLQAVGVEQLEELRVDGEPMTAVSLPTAAEDA